MPQSSLQTMRAVFAIICSVWALSLGDALIKATGLSLPLWQMYILRSVLTVPVLWWLVRRKGPLVVTAPFWVVVRSLLLVVMWLSYYAALPRMPLSLAAAAFYTGPIFILVLSAIVDRKWPSLRSYLAIAAGFVGVLCVIRPEGSEFQLVTLLPVLAAFLYACAMILTSVKCRAESPFLLAMSLNLSFILAGAGMGVFAGQDGSFLFGPWQPVDLGLLMTIAGLACLILIGSVGAAIAYQDGPPATIAAFDYSYLCFSLLWGSVFFAEKPGAISLMGIAFIAGAGLLALSRRAA